MKKTLLVGSAEVPPQLPFGSNLHINPLIALTLLNLEADRCPEQPRHLIPQAPCIAARAATCRRVQAEIAHESVEAGSQLQARATSPKSFRSDPEQQQPGNDTVRIADRAALLPIPARANN